MTYAGSWIRRRPFVVLVVGVVGVVGWDHGAFTFAFHQRPAVVGLLVVVMVAVAVDAVGGRGVGVGPVVAVVVLQAGGAVAAPHGAARLHPFQGGELGGAGAAAEVRH